MRLAAEVLLEGTRAINGWIAPGEGYFLLGLRGPDITDMVNVRD